MNNAINQCARRHWIYVDMRALCTSLDGGHVFAPRPLWDIKMNQRTLGVLKSLRPNAVMIVDNVPYTAPSHELNLFGGQFGWVIACVQEALGMGTWVGGQYSPVNDAIEGRRLPATGMLTSIFEDCLKRYTAEHERTPISLETDALYMGVSPEGLAAARAAGIPAINLDVKEGDDVTVLPVLRYKVINTTTLETAEGRIDRKPLINLTEAQAAQRADDLCRQTGMALFTPVPMHFRPHDGLIGQPVNKIRPVDSSKEEDSNEEEVQ